MHFYIQYREISVLKMSFKNGRSATSGPDLGGPDFCRGPVPILPIEKRLFILDKAQIGTKKIIARSH